MDLTMSMSTTERARVESQANAFNRALEGQGGASQELGRDDFLKILLTQLQNQDPTKPMEDKEFIAQMAQFSSLEQMTNISTGFREMNSLLSSNQALEVLGRTVEVRQGDQLVRGTVSSVTSGATPQITVNEQQFDYSDLVRVVQ
ncbi:MAG: flagellar hook assembly protein FlgD [Spirochaeta sp.]|jgi:flagellar basal-body rod modification protein FlgD|nr:flagellar hook assembly protein FlgD [Spirochaeta sp.]